MKRNVLIKKITLISILSALGMILMLLEIPYPPVPFLQFDLSDVTILVGYATTGFPGAIVIAVIKTGFHLLVKGPVGPYAAGQITALLGSLTYCFLIFIVSKVFRLLTNKFYKRVIGYSIIIVLLTLIMTLLNYIVLTPLFLNQIWVGNIPSLSDFEIGPFTGSYLFVIIAVYVPFNLLKGLLITSTYEVIFNRVIHKYVNNYIIK